MLLQIHDYIRRQGLVSNQQLSRQFGIDSFALQPMLDLWVAKGAIRPCSQRSSCQSKCFKCRTPAEYYEYVRISS